MDNEGWTFVERPERYSEDAAEFLGEEQEETWVVVSKIFGPDKIFIRFPGDPSHQVIEQEFLMDFTNDEGALHFQGELFVGGDLQSFLSRKRQEIERVSGNFLLKSEKGEGKVCFSYWSDGKWVQEIVVASPYALYTLRTESGDRTSAMCQQFVSSLEIQSANSSNF
ncbi:MAG: hypothetical protein HY861_01340 [Chlamydiia bacterium]|nr:hypothetical protein [Chlamydiia bacterium]